MDQDPSSGQAMAIIDHTRSRQVRDLCELRKIHTVQFISIQHVERSWYSCSDECAPDQGEGDQEDPHRCHFHATRRAVESALKQGSCWRCRSRGDGISIMEDICKLFVQSAVTTYGDHAHFIIDVQGLVRDRRHSPRRVGEDRHDHQDSRT